MQSKFKSTFKNEGEAKEMLAAAARYLIGGDDHKTTMFTPTRNGTTIHISLRLCKVGELNALAERVCSNIQKFSEALQLS